MICTSSLVAYCAASGDAAFGRLLTLRVIRIIRVPRMTGVIRVIRVPRITGVIRVTGVIMILGLLG